MIITSSSPSSPWSSGLRLSLGFGEGTGLDFSQAGMMEVEGAVEPFLDFDFGVDEVGAVGWGKELVEGALETHGVVVLDGSGGLGAEDAFEFEVGEKRSPCGFRVLGRFLEATAEFRDEDAVEVGGGGLTIGHAVSGEFGDQAPMKGPVQTFAPAAGLGRMGEDETDGELFHGDFEMSFLDLRALLDMGSAVAGGDELAGAIEVEAGGEALSLEDLITDFETTIAVRGGLELSPERFTGGVAAKEEANLRPRLAEPTMGRAVKEEEFPFPGPTGPPSSMRLHPARGPAMPQGTKPEPGGSPPRA